MTTEMATNAAGPPTHSADVTVNRKPVVLIGPRTTGLAIKQAAIEQGVEIQIDFVLSLRLPSGEYRIIGDRDVVHPRDGMFFVAVAPDDNS